MGWRTDERQRQGRRRWGQGQEQAHKVCDSENQLHCSLMMAMNYHNTYVMGCTGWPSFHSKKRASSRRGRRPNNDDAQLFVYCLCLSTRRTGRTTHGMAEGDRGNALGSLTPRGVRRGQLDSSGDFDDWHSEMRRISSAYIPSCTTAGFCQENSAPAECIQSLQTLTCQGVPAICILAKISRLGQLKGLELARG